MLRNAPVYGVINHQWDYKEGNSNGYFPFLLLLGKLKISPHSLPYFYQKENCIQEFMMSSHANSKRKLTNEEKYRRMRDLNNIASKKCRENQKN